METSSAQHVLSEIAHSLDLLESEVTPDRRLIDIADSLEVAQLVIDLELEFGIEITDDDLKRIFTIEDIQKYVDTHRH